MQWFGIFDIVQLKFVDVSIVPDNGTKIDTKREENIEFRKKKSPHPSYSERKKTSTTWQSIAKHTQ